MCLLLSVLQLLLVALYKDPSLRPRFHIAILCFSVSTSHSQLRCSEDQAIRIVCRGLSDEPSTSIELIEIESCKGGKIWHLNCH